MNDRTCGCLLSLFWGARFKVISVKHTKKKSLILPTVTYQVVEILGVLEKKKHWVVLLWVVKCVT